MNNGYFIGKNKKTANLGKIRSDKQTDPVEHKLNIVMIVMVILTISLVTFIEVRHCIALDNAALSMTQEQWDSIGR